MNTQNYPTWLVPLDIAIELKEIGYKEDCYFEFSKDNGLTLETLERESSIIGIDDLLFWYKMNVGKILVYPLGQKYLLGSELVAYTAIFALTLHQKIFISTLFTITIILINAVGVETLMKLPKKNA